jgi:hypothetical protein
MKITITIEDQKYTHECPVEFPDTEQMMHAIEKIISTLEYPEKEVEDYILDWADEIKMNRDGKS